MLFDNPAFFFLKPYRWYKHIITADISGLMLASENDAEVKAIFDRHDQERWNEVSAIFDENMQLAFQGKLEVEPVMRYEIIPDPDEDEEMDRDPVGEFKYSPRGVEHIVSRIQALVAGLFPYTQAIRLHEIKYLHGEPFNRIEDVKTIRDLVCLIRHEGLFRVEGYRVEFPDQTEGRIEFKEDQMVIKHPDTKMLNLFVEEFEKLK